MISGRKLMMSMLLCAVSCYGTSVYAAASATAAFFFNIRFDSSIDGYPPPIPCVRRGRTPILRPRGRLCQPFFASLAW